MQKYALLATTVLLTGSYKISYGCLKKQRVRLPDFTTSYIEFTNISTIGEIIRKVHKKQPINGNNQLRMFIGNKLCKNEKEIFSQLIKDKPESVAVLKIRKKVTSSPA